MNLEKLEQQAKALQNIDPTKMSEEQLTQLAEQLSSMFEESELLINNLTEEIKTEDDDNGHD